MIGSKLPDCPTSSHSVSPHRLWSSLALSATGTRSVRASALVFNGFFPMAVPSCRLGTWLKSELNASHHLSTLATCFNNSNSLLDLHSFVFIPSLLSSTYSFLESSSPSADGLHLYNPWPTHNGSRRSALSARVQYLSMSVV